MKVENRFARLACLIVLSLSVSLIASVLGCGAKKGKGTPETAPVYGVVNFRGAPLPEGIVKLHPDNATAHPATGMIQADGSFEVTTYSHHDGAVLGKHKVTVMVQPHLDGSSPDPPIQVPKAYHDVSTTPIEVEIMNDSKNSLVLEIEN
ncbi:hypothetical protein [Blastopirellula marina]|uniref:Carboxypeptidase regulatory-like domain-containing protein n=1 Tax=Blastopirellula marina DSM 3645 TaxID=314230 RepID=A3ZZJ0_9BACT|nr:hypothetical protein [Blastopirellula marina]EAQ78069.1 hypothetical protein DSM3645_18651 [Blastopirellula marina DSM 3645]